MLDILHDWMYEGIGYLIFILEMIGVIVLMEGAIRAVYNYIKRDPHTRLKLCRAMAMALEFKLCGEILHTVIVREFSEILLVGGIILLRGAMTFLIHWAITTEEAEESEKVVDLGYKKALKRPQFRIGWKKVEQGEME